MEKKDRCPKCGAETKQYKHGKNASGTSRNICWHCKGAYTPKPQKYAYTEEEKTQAIKIYYEGNSGREVGRILGMSKANAVRWIKERVQKTSVEKE